MNNNRRSRQDRQRDREAAARHPHRRGRQQALQHDRQPAWEPKTRKSLTDMMERAVKAGFYQKMPGNDIIYSP